MKDDSGKLHGILGTKLYFGSICIDSRTDESAIFGKN